MARIDPRIESHETNHPHRPVCLVGHRERIRPKKEKELQQLDSGLQEFGMTIQNDLAQMEQQLLAPMIERVRKAIQDVGAEQGFTYIFDTSTGVTLYNGGEDVTELVKTKLGM